MRNIDIPPELRVLLIVGALAYLFIILLMLKKGKLNVQYSLIWLGSAFVLLLFAVFPYIVALIRYYLGVEVISNLVFMMLFVFVLSLLLSLSVIVTGFAKKIKRLTQTQALLEERIRQLESKLVKSEKSGSSSEEQTTL